MPTATMTSKGQITIPLAVRKKLHLQQGSRVVFEPAGDEYVVRPAKSSLAAAFGSFHREGAHATIEEMNEAIATGASNKARKL
jgi:AbrB family looped-hinge helix DNA binding protein